MILQDSHPDSLQFSWYLVHTQPRQEDVALINLERQGYQCYLPKLRMERVRHRKAVTVDVPLFPRYLFIRLTQSLHGQSWAPIRSTLGVTQVVCFGTTAAKVDEALINALQAREQRHKVQTLFSPGESVVITEGPFAGVEAIYQTTNAEKRALILLEMLNCKTVMQIDVTALDKKGQ